MKNQLYQLLAVAQNFDAVVWQIKEVFHFDSNSTDAVRLDFNQKCSEH